MAIHARENSSQELKLIPTIPSEGTKLEPQTLPMSILEVAF